MTAYDYDPRRPTPAVGGPSTGSEGMPLDNTVHERRPDVAVFRSGVLTEAVEVGGRPIAEIRFRSSAPSFDVFVRVTDVHPDGRSMTVTDGIRRIGSPGAAGPGPQAGAEGFIEVAVPLWPVFHRFLPGHRIGVQVSSGAHPRYARNLGTGEPAITATRAVVAHQEISHAGREGARLILPIISP